MKHFSKWRLTVPCVIVYYQAQNASSCVRGLYHHMSAEQPNWLFSKIMTAKPLNVIT